MSQDIPNVFVSSYEELPHRITISSPFSEKRIFSYGIIPYARDTGRWLIVQRKHTPAFVTILKGNYRNAYLRLLLQGITKEELEILRMMIGHQELVYRYHNKIFTPVNHDEVRYAADRFLSPYFAHCLELSKDNPENSEWIWPRGRPKIHEDPLDCAMREFQEETGVTIDREVLISPVRFVESLRSLNGRVYETTCWLAVFQTERELDDIADKQREILRAEWTDAETARQRLGSSRGKILDQAIEIIDGLFPT